MNMNTPINILIVDDEPKNLAVLELLLEDPGYRLIRAESADQALLALVSHEFALLILDIRMPGMSGFELADLIKQRKKTAQVPIIFLTAYYNEDQDVLAGYETGAVDYLHKPVNPHVLRSKVAVFAELHRKTRELELTNRTLVAEVGERRRAEEQLLELNETLEKRIAERTEALQQADRRKDEFLATLAHELRNPLAPVRNAVHLMQLTGPPAPELDWARDVIDRQTQVMTRLIDDLMDMSRISRGKIELKRENVELAQVIQGAVETSRPIIEECGHELVVTLPPDSVVVHADLTRLAQVFLNLLNNAAKYTERGGRIQLRVDQRASEVVISVADTGIGIPAANLPTIFEMFSQVENAISRSRGGLGIGLCLAKQLVVMHGGGIEAHSEGLGKGSEFRVCLPTVPEPQETAVMDDDPDQTLPTSDLRILVVDDNYDGASTSVSLLRLMGNDVHLAHDGEAAVVAAEEFRPHVVLCDIGLPKMTGYDVARTIRKAPWGRQMVLIAVTGWGQDEDKRKAQSAGFDQHMTKPVDPKLLMKLLAGINTPEQC